MSENEVVKAQDEHLQGNVVVKQHSYLKKVLLTLLCKTPFHFRVHISFKS